MTGFMDICSPICINEPTRLTDADVVAALNVEVARMLAISTRNALGKTPDEVRADILGHRTGPYTKALFEEIKRGRENRVASLLDTVSGRE